ncbi:MAG: peptidylprolyl isomerase [Gemmatimonadaceae bacterium]|jgi:peptidyl-prolyl cis-trans isomerase B (cyclophilin B)|nr:peptidylprolyl isomerase [Gemmatimonadota bacterium]
MPSNVGIRPRLSGAWWPAIAVTLVGVSACTSARPRPVSTGIATERVSDPTIVRDARLLAMTDQRQADTVLVDSLLVDPNPRRRARTALAIGQVRLRARYPRLRQLLVDGDTSIAANAAYALGIAKDTGAVTALARAMAGAPDPVAREAAWALGEIGEPARAMLLSALGDGQPWPRRNGLLAQRGPAVRAAAVLAAVKLRPAPITSVVPWLTDDDAEVVRAAAYVVGRLRAAAAVRAVLAVRAHADEEVRQHVARALTRPTVGDSLAAPARDALRALLADASERVRINAVRSASTFGLAMADDVERLFRDPVPNVRVAAAESFGEVAGRDLARWRRVWEADTLLAVRRTLLPQARRLGVDLAVGIEETWAIASDWRYRVGALNTVDREGPVRPDTAIARRLLGDSDVRVQRAARSRLGIRDSAERAPRSTAPLPRPLAEYEALVRRYIVPGAAPTRAYIDTEYGTVTLELFGRDAPLVVEAFVRLATTGVYRNTIFHRVVPNFVVQDGDTGGDGSGSAGFTLRESWSRQRHERGCLGLATAGPDTGGSQYYLCHASQPHLDGAYTVFGRVVEGFEVMDRIVQGDLMLRVRVQ